MSRHNMRLQQSSKERSQLHLQQRVVLESWQQRGSQPSHLLALTRLYLLPMPKAPAPLWHAEQGRTLCCCCPHSGHRRGQGA